jgi:hypothetical protein
MLILQAPRWMMIWPPRRKQMLTKDFSFVSIPFSSRCFVSVRAWSDCDAQSGAVERIRCCSFFRASISRRFRADRPPWAKQRSCTAGGARRLARCGSSTSRANLGSLSSPRKTKVWRINGVLFCSLVSFSPFFFSPFQSSSLVMVAVLESTGGKKKVCVFTL